MAPVFKYYSLLLMKREFPVHWQSFYLHGKGSFLLGHGNWAVGVAAAGGSERAGEQWALRIMWLRSLLVCCHCSRQTLGMWHGTVSSVCLGSLFKVKISIFSSSLFSNTHLNFCVCSVVVLALSKMAYCFRRKWLICLEGNLGDSGGLQWTKEQFPRSSWTVMATLPGVLWNTAGYSEIK